MRIVCPACAAAYQVPETHLAPGRVVRCARCESDWTPLSDQPAAANPAEAADTAPQAVPEPASITTPPEPVPVALVPKLVEAEDRYVVSGAKRGGVLLKLAWTLSLLLVVSAVAASIVARESVMRVWPPSERAYAAMGLTGRH